MTQTDMLGKRSLLTAQRRGVKLRISQGQMRLYNRSERNSYKGWDPWIKSSACLETEGWQPHHQTYLATCPKEMFITDKHQRNKRTDVGRPGKRWTADVGTGDSPIPWSDDDDVCNSVNCLYEHALTISIKDARWFNLFNKPRRRRSLDGSEFRNKFPCFSELTIENKSFQQLKVCRE
jgi:hypothetical protein